MIRIIKLILFSILFSFISIAQNQNGKILSEENRLPIGNAAIINLKFLDTIFSDNAGQFKLHNSGSHRIIKAGYLDYIINLEQSEYVVVYLLAKPSQLDEIIVTSNHLPKSLTKATTSIEIINESQLKRFNTTDFAPILNTAPGVFMQSGALNTNRITIRGIGARNLFGTSKIRAYFNDIPLTNGSGETTIEDLELTSISEMEIIKGATSSSYGAGLGGTIILKPNKTKSKPTEFSNQFSIGSFGLIKNSTLLNLSLNKNSINVVYSATNSDGFRDNNSYHRKTLTLSSNHKLNKKNSISVLTSLVRLKAFISSSLNETDFNDNPEKAAFTWQQSQGFEDADRGIVGVTWNHKLTNKLSQITSIFTSFRDAYEPRPFNVLTENSFAYGLRSRLLSELILFEKKMNFTIGGEYFRDNYQSETFENLYEDFPSGTGSVQGNKLSNFKENRSYYNLFFEGDYEFSDKTTLTIGLNHNKTAYKLEDRFLVSDNNPDQSGNFKFKSIVSPKLGISHLITRDIHLFSSISQGFSPISLSETLLPNGQINTNLKPETGWNYEIGSRGNVLEGKLQYAISMYRLNIKNLVVSRRTAQDEFIGVNAGKTRHDGLELKLNYAISQSSKFNCQPFLTYTLNNFKFEEFIDGNSNFSGNDLTGVPRQILNLGVDYSFEFGLYGNFNYQFVDEMPITDSNSLYSDAYNLVNLKIGYKTQLYQQLNLNLFFGVNNVFKKQYASQILINASAFGGAPPRYYYPGNPINYYSGVQLNYVF